MLQQTRFYLFIAVLIIIGISVVYWRLSSHAKRKRAADVVKVDYDNAISEGNRTKALAFGRKYYSILRGGNLTIYDEQAITNDLLSIDNKKINERSP